MTNLLAAPTPAPAGVPLPVRLPPRVAKAMGAYAAGAAVYEAAKKVREWHRDRTRYTVSVRETDEMYPEIHAWLVEAYPDLERRAVVAQTVNGRSTMSYVLVEGDEELPGRDLRLLYDDRSEREIVLDGHRVHVAVVRDDNKKTASKDDYFFVEPDVIRFSVHSKAAQEAVVAHLTRIARAKRDETRPPSLWMLTSWGSWRKRSDLPPRTLDSVVLAPGQMDRIVADLRLFLASEGEYGRRGIPWHRGYLLYGPPGTGKTSVARALAGEFGLDVWFAPLGDLTKDASLLSLLAEVHPRSLLLLEDVDVYAASHEREAEKGELSLSGLLNALDGISTPHGLVTILTTNDRSVLDDALRRPGRIDLQEEFSLATPSHAARLFEHFYGEPPPAPFPPGPEAYGTAQQAGRWSPAALVEVFKPRDALSAYAAVVALSPNHRAVANHRAVVDAARA